MEPGDQKSRQRAPWPILEGFPPGYWVAIDPLFGRSHLGMLPEILLASDPRPVRAQLEDRYAHGGGWRPMREHGFKMAPGYVLKFPGDEPFYPTAVAKFGEEVVVFYRRCSLLAILQPDRSWEVTRVD